MTQAERLVRNICDDARTRVKGEHDADMATVPERVAVKDLPADVRKAVATLRVLQSRVDEAKKCISEAGFAVPYVSCVCDDEAGPAALDVDYKVRSERTRGIAQRRSQRLSKVNELQNRAAVASVGLRGDDAKPVLDKLLRDLAAV